MIHLILIRLFRVLLIFLFFKLQHVPCVHCWQRNNSNRPGPRSFFKHPTVVLISFDGFRWDYLEQMELKSFKFISENGVRARSLESSFITKTFPNHFTLVTGLHEESHGIMASKMYDPVYNETFVSSTTSPKWWNAATPIWITNELQNNENLSGQAKIEKTDNLLRNRKSATIFWVGSNVEYDGKLPYFYMPVYNSSFSFEDRFGLILKLLKEEDPPNLIACYFHEPDATSHHYGPDSTNVKNAIKAIDILLGKFLEDLKKEGFLDHVNIVIVSDHGMTNIEPQNQIVLDDFLDPSWYTAVDINVYASLIPKQNYTSTIYYKLKQIPHLTAYLKEEIPEDLHYKNNRRVPPIFAIADESYIIKRKKTNLTHRIGNHGYLNSLKSMHGIFLAIGPAFKKGYIGNTFKNIHVYPMLCSILEIDPLPNNGSLLEVKHFLIDSLPMEQVKNRIIIIKIIFICSIALLFIVSLGCYLQCRRKPLMPDGYVQLSQTGREVISLDILTEDLALEKSSDEDEI